MTTDSQKTKAQLLQELSALKGRVAQREKAALVPQPGGEAEEAQQQNEELYRSLFENMLNGFAYCRMLFHQNQPLDFIYLRVNHSFEALTGLKNVIGKKVSEVIPGIQETDPELFEIYGRVALSGRPERFEIYLEALKEWFFISVYSPQKEHFVAVFEVITERKRAEEALKKSEEAARRLAQENAIMAEIGRIAGSTLNLEEVYERFCQEVRKLLEFDNLTTMLMDPGAKSSLVAHVSGTEVTGREMGTVVPLEGTALEEVLRSRVSLLLQKEDLEDAVRRFPGLRPAWEAGRRAMMIVPLISKNQVIGTLNIASRRPEAYTRTDLATAERVATQIAGAVANARLFRERERAQEELRESEERYRRLVENAPLGILSMDPSGKVIDVNSRVLSILGSPSAEATRAINMLTFPPLMEAGIAGNFRLCLETGTGGVFESAYRSAWGKDIFLRHTLTPILDPEGRITGVQAILEDVSGRKKLEDQLLQAQKMEAIGTLAGGIAHDFNNILAAILGYAELASIKAQDDPEITENLQQCLQAVHRAKDLVRQILTFSRQGKQERKPMDIRPIVKEGLKFLRASLPVTIEIRENIDGNLGVIEADPTQIHQMLMNLCTNAAHAMREKGGTLEVSLAKFILTPERSSAIAELEPGPYLKLRVSDTGHGMPPEVLRRIFDPYFTTKQGGEGTGLGLAVVHGIVKSYRGGITVSSEPGKGTAFEIYLPGVYPAREPVRAVKPEPLPLGGNERILFVDDESAIVEVAQGIIERLGYKVEVRTSSIEAREMFRANPDRFELVITDMTMPNMTGDKLAQEILSIRPGIPIILCTGFSEYITEERAKAMGIQEFVMKPLVMRDLATVIRRALDRRKKKKG
jgi:PAS domain S-box-containing protein